MVEALSKKEVLIVEKCAHAHWTNILDTIYVALNFDIARLQSGGVGGGKVCAVRQKEEAEPVAVCESIQASAVPTPVWELKCPKVLSRSDELKLFQVRDQERPQDWQAGQEAELRVSNGHPTNVSCLSFTSLKVGRKGLIKFWAIHRKHRIVGLMFGDHWK